MGALSGIMIPGRDVAWPAIDRNDPAYQLDYRLVTGAGADMHAAMQHQY